MDLKRFGISSGLGAFSFARSSQIKQRIRLKLNQEKEIEKNSISHCVAGCIQIPYVWFHLKKHLYRFSMPKPSKWSAISICRILYEKIRINFAFAIVNSFNVVSKGERPEYVRAGILFGSWARAEQSTASCRFWVDLIPHCTRHNWLQLFVCSFHVFGCAKCRGRCGAVRCMFMLTVGVDDGNAPDVIRFKFSCTVLRLHMRIRYSVNWIDWNPLTDIACIIYGKTNDESKSAFRSFVWGQRKIVEAKKQRWWMRAFL